MIKPEFVQIILGNVDVVHSTQHIEKLVVDVEIINLKTNECI